MSKFLSAVTVGLYMRNTTMSSRVFAKSRVRGRMNFVLPDHVRPLEHIVGAIGAGAAASMRSASITLLVVSSPAQKSGTRQRLLENGSLKTRL